MLGKGDSKKVFYHSRTGQEFTFDECSEDSEDQVDESFIEENEAKLIDELENSASQEKSFMKLWNHHIYEAMPHEVQIKQVCISFIKKYSKELIPLRIQWSLHLITLCEYHVLTGDDLLYLQLLFHTHLN